MNITKENVEDCEVSDEIVEVLLVELPEREEETIIIETTDFQGIVLRLNLA